MFCKNCGKEVADECVICPHCGCKTGYENIGEDSSSKGWGVLGFFFPIIGFILYLVWKEKYPMKAHNVGKGALIGVIVEVVLSIISIVVSSCVAASLLNNVVYY